MARENPAFQSVLVGLGWCLSEIEMLVCMGRIIVFLGIVLAAGC